MPKARIPMAQQISTRDGTLSKDAKLVNCMVEKSGEKVVVTKRPGMYTFAQFPVGLGQGLFTINGVPYAMFNDVMYLCFPPFTSLAVPLNPTGAAPLPPVPTPAPLPQYAVFMSGSTAAVVYTSAVDKYAYVAGTMTPGAYMLSAGVGYSASGNYSVGIWWNTTNQKYTYSNDSVAAGSVNISNPQFASATGNANEAIIISGFVAVLVFASGKINKYTYSSDTSVATGASIVKMSMGAIGTATQGIFSGGTSIFGNPSSNTTSKYLYSNDTISSGSNLGVARDSLAATGTTTEAILTGGRNGGTVYNYTDKYIYSGDVVSSSTALSFGRFFLNGAGTTNIGVFAGGDISTATNAATATVDIYTYATDVVSAGTSLITARYGMGATSTSPGGF